MTHAAQSKLPPSWLDELKARVSLSGLIGRAVKLQRAGREFKGLCPFHSEKTGSFTVNEDKGFYHCFGCGAHGDAIRWEVEHNSKAFIDAAIDLADSVGLALPDGFVRHPGRAQPVAADARVQRQLVKRAPDVDIVSSEEMGEVILRRCTFSGAVVDPHPMVHRYLASRGFDALEPEHWSRWQNIHFCPNAPVAKWRRDRGVEHVAAAPAMVARLRQPDPALPVHKWPVTGLHITYFNNSCTGKMERRNARGEIMPARKMLGEIQGSCVVLGRYVPDAPLVVGEGIETTLSGLAELIAAGRVPPDACAIAALSLNNLQGYPLLDGRGALPVWNLRPDPARAALFFAHKGPVFVLVDADMKGFPVRHRPRDGKPVAPKIAEARRGPYIIREISGEERAEHCAALARAGWLAAGAPHVEAYRPRIGMDFNDQGRV